MRLRKLSEVIKENSDYKPGWRVLEEEVGGQNIVTGFDNPRFGRIEMWVHCKDDGSPLYDQPIISEGPADENGERPTASGAVIIPYFLNDSNQINVGLIEQNRAVVRNPETGEPGYLSSETPRGFGGLAEAEAQTAIRELGEETRKVAKELYRLGNVNAGVNVNTAFYATHATVWVAEVDPSIESKLTPDSKEPILKCDFLPYKKVREMADSGKIVCALSLAGMMLFDTFIERKYKK